MGELRNSRTYSVASWRSKFGT